MFVQVRCSFSLKKSVQEKSDHKRSGPGDSPSLIGDEMVQNGVDLESGHYAMYKSIAQHI